MSLVLVADDEPAVLEVLSQVVEELGHQVLRAHDGQEALHLARARRPNLVITDHVMPQLSGLELCRQLKCDEALKAVPVIVLSAALPEGAPEARAFLHKPFELSDLERLVVSALEEDHGKPARQAVFDDGQMPAAQRLPALAAHAMAEPLSAARSLTRALEAELSGGRRRTPHPLLRELHKAIAQLEDLHSALVELGSPPPSTVSSRHDLAALVFERVADWQRRAGPNAVTVEGAQTPVWAWCDPALVHELLETLIAPALNGLIPGEQVQVKVGVEDKSAVVRLDCPAGLALHGVEVALASHRLTRDGGEVLSLGREAGRVRFAVRLPRTL